MKEAATLMMAGVHHSASGVPLMSLNPAFDEFSAEAALIGRMVISFGEIVQTTPSLVLAARPASMLHPCLAAVT
jgi:hypothetical protein